MASLPHMYVTFSQRKTIVITLFAQILVIYWSHQNLELSHMGIVTSSILLRVFGMIYIHHCVTVINLANLRDYLRLTCLDRLLVITCDLI